MNAHLKRVLLLTAALVCIILGIVGLVLPFLQGLLFIAIGLILLSIASPSARSWIDSHTIRFPKVHALYIKIQKRIEDVIGTQ